MFFYAYTIAYNSTIPLKLPTMTGGHKQYIEALRCYTNTAAFLLNFGALNKRLILISV